MSIIPDSRLLRPRARIWVPQAPAIRRPRPVSIRIPQMQRTSPQDVKFSLDERTQLIFDQVKIEAEQLEDAAMRDLWLDALQTYASTGDLEKLIKVCEWRRKVVPLDEFLFGQTYMRQGRPGQNEGGLYYPIVDMLYALDTGEYLEAVLTGSIGSGKTVGANLGMGRELYKISCMRHPQTTFASLATSSLVFTIQSVRLGTARKAVFQEFGTVVRNSPYFKEIYPYNYKITSEMRFEQQNVTIMPVSSSSTGAISMNVIGGQLDEVNFMQKIVKSKSSEADAQGSFDQAKKLYDTVVRRRASRFTRQGKLPGIFFIISSVKFPDDFTEKRAQRSVMEGGDDKSIYVYRHSLWSAKGEGHFMQEKFRVQVGNDYAKTRVLEEGEQGHPGCEIIEVPMDFHQNFKDDPDGALRDFAGITTLSLKPFISKRDSIAVCMKAGAAADYVNPYLFEEYDLSRGIPQPDPAKLRTDIRAPRHAHIDQGLTKDAAGLAIGHVVGTKMVTRKDPLGGPITTEIQPVIAYDVILRIVPPHGGEIELAYIRRILFMLRDEYDLPIETVTLDGFQSADARQILRKGGFKAGYLSVEAMEPYRSFRDGLYDSRVLLPKHSFLAKEIAGLEIVQTNGGKEKVDHRPQGSKDVCDGVCGVYNFLITRKSSWLNTNRIVDAVPKQAPEAKQEVDDWGMPVKPPEIPSDRPQMQRKKLKRKAAIRRELLRKPSQAA